MDSGKQSKPFERFHARSLIKWPLIVGLILSVLTERWIRWTTLAVTWSVLFAFEIHIVVAFWMIWQCRRNKISIRRLLGKWRLTISDWVLIGMSIPVLLFSIGSVWLRLWLRYFLVVSFGQTAFANWLAYRPEFIQGMPVLNVAIIFSNVLIGPAVEELAFRGLILHRWAHKWGIRPAVIASSIAFAATHKDALGAFVFGLVAALLYLRTRSLWAAVSFHAIFNVLVLVSQSTLGLNLWWNGALCLAIGVVFLLAFNWVYWPKQEVSMPYFSSDTRI